jgi:hypothetical protein
MTELLDVKAGLLEALETAVAPAHPGPVIIRDLFKKNARVRFSTIFAEFKNRFFDKTERPAAEAAYRQYKLPTISADGPILEELGGVSQVEGSLAAAFAFLQCQPNGDAGFLQTNGCGHIFHAKDKKQQLCAIRIGWTSDGWVVDAMSVADPQAWHGEHLIFKPGRL